MIFASRTGSIKISIEVFCTVDDLRKVLFIKRFLFFLVVCMFFFLIFLRLACDLLFARQKDIKSEITSRRIVANIYQFEN